ncbi:hypothetical protein HZA73_00635 [candidate division TA06 bacterium]|nr:hypothetical protein [candidate division TA06 bacterium]
MSKVKIIVLAFMLSLICLATAYATPDCVCWGYVYYGGSQVTSYTCELYNSPINDFKTFNTTSWYHMGLLTWPTGTYYLCVKDTYGHWYHYTISHVYGNNEQVTANLSSSSHPRHPNEQ